VLSYFFILNPASGRGKRETLQRHLLEWVSRNLPSSKHAFTEGPGHAAELAQRAQAQGFSRVIAVGGDGTLHETAIGLMKLKAKDRPSLGTIAAGTGGDFARGLKEGYGLNSGWEWLKEPREIDSDVGKITFRDSNDKSSTTYFVNIADVGISGEVTRRVNISDKLLGSLEYLKSTLIAARHYHSPRARIKVGKGEQEILKSEVELLLLVVANGRYFGGGMCIAPEARIDDQLFEVMIVEKIPYTSLLKELPKIYFKKKLTHPAVHYAQGSFVEVETLADPLPVGTDGEFLEARSVRFEMVPKALKLLV